MARSSRQKHDYNTASTDRAKELQSIYKIGEFTEWDAETHSKESARIYKFGCGLTDVNGVALRGILVDMAVLVGTKVEFSNTRATLFELDKDTRQKVRVIQVENRQPIDEKGGINHEVWPHMHFGQDYKKLGRDIGSHEMTVQQTLDFFANEANIYFNPEVHCDFEAENFQLTPLRYHGKL